MKSLYRCSNSFKVVQGQAVVDSFMAIGRELTIISVWFLFWFIF